MGTVTDRMTVGIIGYGRFGKILARMLRPDFDLIIHDKVKKMPPDGDSAGLQFVSREEIIRAQAIFVAVPIRDFKEVIADLAPRLRTGTTVLDVCSVKVYPALVMQEHLPEGVHAIATHPLFGPDSSRDSWENLPMVIHPVNADDDIYQGWLEYFRHKGLNMQEMTPEEHDRLAARTQGITHFIGRILEDVGIEPTPIDTEGFRDLQMVVEQTCHDSMALFRDLQRFNPYTAAVIDQLMNAAGKICETIAERN
ncbi:MAG: prephenate dehydrogenase/arogenate dehydrogenase family protein [Candidatus Marinimicrobia bacterium]|nr:prephenate dehydrogenase/arogenate dehydrogenase family protein [Candidatus Neomarinimicrobiota bacterium]